MPAMHSDETSDRRMEFDQARAGAGNLYFNIVNNNTENIDFEDTVTTLSGLTGFLDRKTRHKIDSIIQELHRSNELDPDSLISVFDELGIMPRKMSTKMRKIQPKIEKRPLRPDTIKEPAKQPHQTSPILLKGRELQEKGDINGAIYYYDKSIRDGCRDIEVITELAALFMILGDVDHAIKYYDIALNIKPNSVELLSEKAAALVIGGQYNGAMNCHETIIKLMPNSKRGWREKGVLQLKLGKYHRAVTCFQKILELEPKDVESLGNLALCYKEMNDPRKEIEYLNKFLHLKPDDRDAWMERADVFIRYGRHKNALKCYNSILKNDPNDFIVLRKKADILFKMGMNGEAAACQKKANELMPVKHSHIDIPLGGDKFNVITSGLSRLNKLKRD